MAPRRLPDAGYLRECFDYEPSAGKLYRRHRPRRHFHSLKAYNIHRHSAGLEAGWDNYKIGFVLSLDGKTWLVSRIIWKIMTGHEPKAFIDHKNGDPCDNRWSNLREATRTQNNRNTKKRRGCARLPKGVHRTKLGRYQAQICLGTFNTIKEAHAAYCRVARTVFGEFFSPG